MTARLKTNVTYLVLIVATLLLRISVNEGIGGFEGTGLDHYFTVMAQIVCFLLVPVAMYFLLHKKGQTLTLRTLSADFGFKKVGLRNSLRTLVIGIAMVYMATVVSFLWSNMLTLFGYTHTSTPTEYDSIGILFLELFMTAVLPGFCEEFAHRGLLFYGYRDSGFKVVIVSALLFSLMHQNIRQTGYTFFDGIVMALLCYYTGSIWPSIFVHFFNNAVSVLWGYGDYAGGWLSFMEIASDWLYGSLVGYVVGAIIFVLCGVVMVLMFKRMRDDAVRDGVIPQQPFAKNREGALPLHKDVILYVTIALGIGATIFTLVWGILR
jgi:membrane protease YdiL (CAAX protease family)